MDIAILVCCVRRFLGLSGWKIEIVLSCLLSIHYITQNPIFAHYRIIVQKYNLFLDFERKNFERKNRAMAGMCRGASQQQIQQKTGF